jgi:Subtilisin inhibitor-like
VGDRKLLPAMKRAGAERGPAARRLLAFSFPILMLIAGCTNQIAEPSGPNQGTTPMPQTPSSSTPGEASSATPGEAGTTDLTIVVNDDSGKTWTWRLACDPPSGSHPDPKAACRVLKANGAAALPPVPEDKVCTQIYGGPETATITGTWEGKQVLSQFARNDGCQISRWKLMEGLLPPAGS